MYWVVRARQASREALKGWRVGLLGSMRQGVGTESPIPWIRAETFPEGNRSHCRLEWRQHGTDSGRSQRTN